MKYTVGSLINVLKNFPMDLPIENELAFYWHYDEIEETDADDSIYSDFREYTMNNAKLLCIFEGSWDKGNTSDVDGIYEKYHYDEYKKTYGGVK